MIQLTNKQIKKINLFFIKHGCRTSENEITILRSAIVHSRDGLNKVATKLYLFSKRERENIDKNPKRMTIILVVATKLGFESQLRKGKILTPLSSVVLNVNRLVSCAR